MYKWPVVHLNESFKALHNESIWVQLQKICLITNVSRWTCETNVCSSLPPHQCVSRNVIWYFSGSCFGLCSSGSCWHWVDFVATFWPENCKHSGKGILWFVEMEEVSSAKCVCSCMLDCNACYFVVIVFVVVTSFKKCLVMIRVHCTHAYTGIRADHCPLNHWNVSLPRVADHLILKPAQLSSFNVQYLCCRYLSSRTL